MGRLSSWWLGLRDSLWFLPAAIVFAGAAAAVALIEAQPLLDADLSARWPRLFGAGAEGARGMLSAIATSMVTVAGVVFSITILALSLAASQYSPRVLRGFMADRPTQVVLGTFMAVFVYCLVVLRTIRGADEGTFVPSLAVLGGVFMALAGVALLIYYIHHLALAIQVPSIVTRIAADTAQAIDDLFPAELGSDPAVRDAALPPGALPSKWSVLPAPCTGYLVVIDSDALLERAHQASVVVRIVPRMGGFVVQDQPLAMVGGAQPPAPSVARSIIGCFTLERERTVHQDAAYGLQQLVDVALKALSPGIHDPTTAIACIDQLGALMARLARRRIEGPLRFHEGALRVIAEGAGYADMMALSFTAITHHADGHIDIYARVLDTLELIAGATSDRERRAAIARQLDHLLQRIGRADVPHRFRASLLRRGRSLHRELRDGSQARLNPAADCGSIRDAPKRRSTATKGRR